MTKIPAVIHPHLLPFFYEEFAGKEFNYGDKSFQKLISINRASPLGSLIYQFSDSKNKIYLHITSVPGALRSHFYGYLTCNANNPITMSPSACQCINDMLEDMMRTALVFYVMGAAKHKKEDKRIHKAIEAFMCRYSLYDFDYNVEQLRMVYYRAKRSDNHLQRTHNKRNIGPSVTPS